MGAEPQRGLTRILGQDRVGDERARGELVALVYDELRRAASRLMRRERPDHTLSPTAVVHEAVMLAHADLAGPRRGWLLAEADPGDFRGVSRSRPGAEGMARRSGHSAQ
jgi:hypothetical protein